MCALFSQKKSYAFSKKSFLKRKHDFSRKLEGETGLQGVSSNLNICHLPPTPSATDTRIQEHEQISYPKAWLKPSNQKEVLNIAILVIRSSTRGLKPSWFLLPTEGTDNT